jgi:hypothetical protein
VPILALQIDLDRFGIDIDVLFDHFEQFTAQERQVVRATTRTTLLRDDDA